MPPYGVSFARKGRRTTVSPVTTHSYLVRDRIVPVLIRTKLTVPTASQKAKGKEQQQKRRPRGRLICDAKKLFRRRTRSAVTGSRSTCTSSHPCSARHTGAAPGTSRSEVARSPASRRSRWFWGCEHMSTRSIVMRSLTDVPTLLRAGKRTRRPHASGICNSCAACIGRCRPTARSSARWCCHSLNS